MCLIRVALVRRVMRQRVKINKVFPINKLITDVKIFYLTPKMINWLKTGYV